MLSSNRLTELLKIKHPIIQGPFGGNLSTIELVAAVSNSGGLGSYGAHILSPVEIKKLIGDIRSATQNPFAINLWVSNFDEGYAQMSEEEFESYLEPFKPFYDELHLDYPSYPESYYEDFETQVEALIEEAPAVFSFVFGVPDTAILKDCKKNSMIRSVKSSTITVNITLLSVWILLIPTIVICLLLQSLFVLTTKFKDFLI